MSLNADGQRHADWFGALGDAWVPLRDANGQWTGHGLARDQLRYTAAEKARARSHGFPDIDGLARFDYHERFGPVRIETGARVHMLLHRGGSGYLEDPGPLPSGAGVKYGGVALSDIDDSAYPLGKPRAAGDGRGVMPLDDAGEPDDQPGLFVARPAPLPHMLYKGPNPDGTIPWGSLWWAYSDLGGEWGGETHYLPVCWSFLNARGGGMVRAVLRDGTRVRQLDVARETCGVYTDTDGARIGDARGQYVRTASKMCGWMLAAVRTIFTGPDWIRTLERVE